MADLRKNGSTSNRVRLTLKDKTTGQGKTGLSASTSGLIISTICDNEASAVAYTQAGSTIETIATLGTFATPTASKCRFKEVDSTNHKGLYEFQFANARFAVANATRLIISVNDAESTILDGDYEIDLGSIASVASTTWDEVLTGATHNLANSAGKLLRLVNPTNDAIYPASGAVNLTAATSTTATLDASASTGPQAYQFDVLNILTGTGAGQSRIITNYTTGRAATISPPWTTTPDATSTFDITPTASVQVVSYVAGQDPATLTWAAATRTLTDKTGFSLAASQHVIVDSGTVTTLTTLPAIPANWLTAAGIAAGALDGKGDWSTGGGGGVDVISINGTTFAGPNIPAKLADGVTHGGTSAILSLRSATVNNSNGPGVRIFAAGSGNTALELYSGEGRAFLATSDQGNPDLGTFEVAGGSAGRAIKVTGPYTTAGAVILIDATAGVAGLDGGPGMEIRVGEAGRKAILLTGVAATDALAIAAGGGSPVDVFDAEAGVGLKASALDGITDAELTGPPANFRQRLRWLCQRFATKGAKTKSGTSGTIVVKTAAGATATTQAYTDDGAGNQTQDNAT